ncbi:MAG: hypothetical protein M1309_01550 [Actinobacteria bacterium]|nr:hypothetical protein [Actinomycetota bacterium]
MKTTVYFDRRRREPDRKMITDDWIVSVIENPVCAEIQRDGRLKLWGKIPGQKRYLRIIPLEDGETVQNAFLDRRFKP